MCRISDNPPVGFGCPTRGPLIEEKPQLQEQEQQQQQQLQQQQLLRPKQKKPSKSLIAFTNEKIDASNYFTASTRPRSSLPKGTACRSVKDAEVCCSSRDSSPERLDQFCIPAPPGETFPSGNHCEASSWVKEYAEHSMNRFSQGNEGICSATVDDRKIKLPRLSSCSRMASKRACCMTKDHDGNPCVPSRGFTRFSSGYRCESSIFVANNQPDNVGKCGA